MAYMRLSCGPASMVPAGEDTLTTLGLRKAGMKPGSGNSRNRVPFACLPWSAIACDPHCGGGEVRVPQEAIQPLARQRPLERVAIFEAQHCSEGIDIVRHGHPTLAAIPGNQAREPDVGPGRASHGAILASMSREQDLLAPCPVTDRLEPADQTEFIDHGIDPLGVVREKKRGLLTRQALEILLAHL